jgi:hypothetical protein
MLEEKKTRGRPQIGESKRVALTLSHETWTLIDCLQGLEHAKMSERLRFVIDEYFRMTQNREQREVKQRVTNVTQ